MQPKPVALVERERVCLLREGKKKQVLGRLNKWFKPAFVSYGISQPPEKVFPRAAQDA